MDPLRVAYRTDGLGFVAPSQARRPYYDVVWFVFGEQPLRCGTESRFFFVKTQGRGIRTVGEIRIVLASGDFKLLNNTLIPSAH